MNKSQYLRQLEEKRDNKRRGQHWGMLYGILMKIHKEIDPILRARDKVLEELTRE